MSPPATPGESALPALSTVAPAPGDGTVHALKNCLKTKEIIVGIVNHLDHDRKRMTVTAEGQITLADIRAHLDYEQSEGGLAYPELIDGLQAAPAFSAGDVRRLVSWLEGYAREGTLGPTAIVVSTPFAYGMMRMLDLLVEDFCEIRPFYSQDEAELWLAERPLASRP
jgi:hypothetical protein